MTPSSARPKQSVWKCWYINWGHQIWRNIKNGYFCVYHCKMQAGKYELVEINLPRTQISSSLKLLYMNGVPLLAQWFDVETTHPSHFQASLALLAAKYRLDEVKIPYRMKIYTEFKLVTPAQIGQIHKIRYKRWDLWNSNISAIIERFLKKIIICGI